MSDNGSISNGFNNGSAEATSNKIPEIAVAEVVEIAEVALAVAELVAEVAEDCPICYEPIGVQNACSTACSHRFHTSCLIQAVITRSTCPCCREPLVTTPVVSGWSQVAGIPPRPILRRSDAVRGTDAVPLQRANGVNLNPLEPGEVDDSHDPDFMRMLEQAQGPVSSLSDL